MVRTIYVVNATQVAQDGIYSAVSGFPKNFDPNSYQGDEKKAFRRAKSAFYAQCSNNYAVDGKKQQTVTLSQSNGVLLMRDSDEEEDLDSEAEG